MGDDAVIPVTFDLVVKAVQQYTEASNYLNQVIEVYRNLYMERYLSQLPGGSEVVAPPSKAKYGTQPSYPHHVEGYRILGDNLFWNVAEIARDYGDDYIYYSSESIPLKWIDDPTFWEAWDTKIANQRQRKEEQAAKKKRAKEDRDRAEWERLRKKFGDK